MLQLRARQNGQWERRQKYLRDETHKIDVAMFEREGRKT
jgi:hypothetical protein